MSEYELILMHKRLQGAKLQKAERGELIQGVPCGYLKLPTGEAVLDPDEQARSTVQLVFDKFDELGSFGRLYRYLLRNRIRLGMRVQRGARRGQLEWRPPTRATLARMLHHPIYAGAYSYGRRRVDRKRTASDEVRAKIREVPMSNWTVLQTDRLPAYITWEHYLANQERLLQNRYQPGSVGAPRSGKALLSGILVCGTCGRRMHASYRSKSTAYYVCMRRRLEGSDCRGLAAAAIDDLVTGQVLRALEPAALELSLKAIDNVQRERHASTGTGSNDSSGPPMRSSAPNASIRPSSLRTVWWPAAWSSNGRRRCVPNANCGKSMIDSYMSNRLGSRTRNAVGSWRSPPTFPHSGTRPRRPRGIARRLYGFSPIALWSMFAPTPNSPKLRSRGEVVRPRVTRSSGRSLGTSLWANTIG